MKHPLGAFALSAAKLAALRNSGVKVPHVVVPNRRRSKWGPALFVSDYVGNVVQEFQPERAGGIVTATISDVVGPQGMDTDRHDNLYVTSQGHVGRQRIRARYLHGVKSPERRKPAGTGLCRRLSRQQRLRFEHLCRLRLPKWQHSNLRARRDDADRIDPRQQHLLLVLRLLRPYAGNVWYDYLDTNFVTGVAEYVPSTGTITAVRQPGNRFPRRHSRLRKGLALDRRPER